MRWDSWLATWRMHAETPAFKRKLRDAVDIAEQGYSYGRLFCAMSGGKDSVALASMLCAAGLREKIPLVHIHTELNTPGMLEAAQATAEKLDMDLEVIDPDVEPHADIWAFLRSLPADIPITDERNHLPLRRAIASGNMLVWYEYTHRYEGSFSGMRADESRGRKWNRKMRGPLYQLVSDGSWMCLPIVDWTARDVFARAVQSGLPIHPHYRALYERFGISPESPGSRVDCVITSDAISAKGSIAHARSLYPALWRKLVDARPELGRLT